MTDTPERPSTDALIGAMADHMGTLSVDEFMAELRNAGTAEAAHYMVTEELLDTLADVINQACYDRGELDSMALSAYAHGLRVLAEYGRVKITSEYGRRVIAEWVR